VNSFIFTTFKNLSVFIEIHLVSKLD